MQVSRPVPVTVAKVPVSGAPQKFLEMITVRTNARSPANRIPARIPAHAEVSVRNRRKVAHQHPRSPTSRSPRNPPNEIAHISLKLSITS
jgi:hypothetical protein